MSCTHSHKKAYSAKAAQAPPRGPWLRSFSDDGGRKTMVMALGGDYANLARSTGGDVVLRAFNQAQLFRSFAVEVLSNVMAKGS
jgi:hypothetical protein